LFDAGGFRSGLAVRSAAVLTAPPDASKRIRAAAENLCRIERRARENFPREAEAGRGKLRPEGSPKRVRRHGGESTAARFFRHRFAFPIVPKPQTM
jgi:hypothetical protein